MPIKVKLSMIGVVLILTLALFASQESSPQPNTNRQPAAMRSSYITHVMLCPENGFADTFEQGSFTRNGDSGPGTGQFIGRGFEFAKGSCYNLEPKWLEKRGWISESLGCGGMLLQSDWCARLKSNTEITYTLHFLSWTRGPVGPNQKCMGDCANNNHHTAYIRIRSN